MHRVIGIVGTSRSGSTVFASLLATQPGVVNLGETRRMWSKWRNPDGRCSCGVRLSECGFWNQVMEHADIDPLASTEVTAEQMERLYAAVAAVSGAETLIDTSKHPRYFDRILSAADWSFVNVVRDPRGVLASAKRGWNKRDGSAPATPTLAEVLKSTVSWQRRQRGAGRLCRRTASQVVRYEELVGAPYDVIGRVLGTAAVELPAELAHVAAGNPSKSRTGVIKLNLDQAWLGFPSWVKAVGYVAGLPLTRRYGYRLRP